MALLQQNNGGLGLLAGFAKGLMGGIQGYREERGYQDSRRDKEAERAFQQSKFDVERQDSDRNFGLRSEAAGLAPDPEKPGLFTESKLAGEKRLRDNTLKIADDKRKASIEALSKEGYEADFDESGNMRPNTKRKIVNPYHAPPSQFSTTQPIRVAGGLMKDPAAQKEVVKLNAASGAQSLVDSIRNGDLKDSSNVAKQLTNLIATIEMGAPGGVSDREQMGVDTLYTKLAKTKSYLESKPNSAIPKEYLDQLEHEVQALGDRAGKSYKRVTDAIIEGADDTTIGGKGTTAQLARQRQRKLLEGAGFDPETGAPIRKAPPAKSAGAKAPGWSDAEEKELQELEKKFGSKR